MIYKSLFLTACYLVCLPYLLALGPDKQCESLYSGHSVPPDFKPKAFTLKTWPWIPKLFSELIPSQNPTLIPISEAARKWLNELGIAHRQVLFPVSYPIFPTDESPVGKAYADLMKIFSTTHFDSKEEFKTALIDWFSRHTAGEWRPIFWPEILERSSSLTEQAGIPEARFLVEGRFMLQPKVYGQLASEKLLPILDIHDILLHAPMFVITETRDVARDYFRFAAQLPITRLYHDKALEPYRHVRLDHYEDFVFLDSSLHLLVGFGGNSGRMAISLLDLLEWTPLHSAEPTGGRGFWRNLKSRLRNKYSEEVLRKMIASKYIAERALKSDVANFKLLSQEHQALLAWIYISAAFESNPGLVNELSFQNSLNLWQRDIAKADLAIHTQNSQLVEN